MSQVPGAQFAGVARRLIAVLCALALIVSSLIHTCGHDDAIAGATASLEMVTGSADDGSSADSKTLVAHHCSGCVGVVLPVVAAASDVAETIGDSLRSPAPAFLRAHDPALHTPPPKALT